MVGVSLILRRHHGLWRRVAGVLSVAWIGFTTNLLFIEHPRLSSFGSSCDTPQRHHVMLRAGGTDLEWTIPTTTPNTGLATIFPNLPNSLAVDTHLKSFRTLTSAYHMDLYQFMQEHRRSLLDGKVFSVKWYTTSLDEVPFGRFLPDILDFGKSHKFTPQSSDLYHSFATVHVSTLPGKQLYLNWGAAVREESNLVIHAIDDDRSSIDEIQPGARLEAEYDDISFPSKGFVRFLEKWNRRSYSANPMVSRNCNSFVNDLLQLLLSNSPSRLIRVSDAPALETR